MRTILRGLHAHAAAFGVLICLLSVVPRALALEPAAMADLASDETSDKARAIDTIAAAGDEEALTVLEALLGGDLQVTPDKHFLIKRSSGLVDAISGSPVSPEPDEYDKVRINNRLRAQTESAIAGLRLLSRDPAVRLEAAKAIDPSRDNLPLLGKALSRESVPEIRNALRKAEAVANLHSPDPASQLAAIETLAGSTDPRVKADLMALSRSTAKDQESPAMAKVHEAAADAVKAIERRLAMYAYLGRFFTGASLASVLLLVALGLAITYGLLGVINMAHGEMLMIGAYATYMTQQIFRDHFPHSVDWYLVFAVPTSFVIAAAVGMLLERTVIRWLYGRPLETLLATWGISLFLIQLVRQIFGAQNVEVANPSWMSGGIEFSNLVFPYNRIVIIAFSGAVLLLVWLLLSRTRLGLFIRGVTQNRTMAACMGVRTGRVDLLAFGLGSGIGGLAGCALSQIGNVGPDLGQSYIIDSFMVVVLGGVGQLLGTVYAALGLGVVSKFLEPYIGAVPTKILILVLIIAFIQKRPQGLFALKGRAVEA
ncbi:MAG: urea ABC transporter permease subunit UrtB [Betaproteobacteria bacterium]|nr:urea ABC transporter permease subunit UrtB [Betaproteobacteria bacterium]